jgi:hypothetical protein
VRVTRPGGVVAFCNWSRQRKNPLDPFWDAVRELNPEFRRRRGESDSVPPYVVLGSLGVEDIERITIRATVRYEQFEDWWGPMTEGVGPSARYAKSLDDEGRAILREQMRARYPAEPIVVEAVCVIVRGRVPGD